MACGNTTAMAAIAWFAAALLMWCFPTACWIPYFKRAFPLKHLKKQVYWLAREYRVLRDARAVCFTTPIERDSAAGTLWPQRWNPVVVSFGTSEPAGDPATQREIFWRVSALRQRRFFLFLSRIHSKKGCDLLLEALAGWRRRIRIWTW
jgi:glycosyltransferase involved in cell wall biosynthesis